MNLNQKVSRNQLSKMCHVTLGTVDLWIKQGVPHSWRDKASRRTGLNEKEPMFDVGDVFYWWQEQQVAKLQQ